MKIAATRKPSGRVRTASANTTPEADRLHRSDAFLPLHIKLAASNSRKENAIDSIPLPRAPYVSAAPSTTTSADANRGMAAPPHKRWATTYVSSTRPMLSAMLATRATTEGERPRASEAAANIVHEKLV